jgi:fucose permease
MATTLPAQDEQSADYMPPPRGGRYENVLLAVLFSTFGFVFFDRTLIVTYTGLGCFTLFMATIPAETVPRAVMATALGLIMGTGEIVGGFIAPYLAGRLSDAFDLNASMLISSGAAAVVVLLSFALKETAPIRIARRAQLIGSP